MNANALWEGYLAQWTLSPGRTGVVVFGFIAVTLLVGRWSWRLASIAAALFSLWYVRNILHGAPRIIDAATYWFQSKHLFGRSIEVPTALFRGRFLIEGPDGALHGIFPPGYPTLLALFQALGAPLLLGPYLAALLVWRTHAFTRAGALELSMPAAQAKAAAALGASLCAANLCLRYHTADTMSHGLTALMVLSVLHACLARRPALAGLALGVIACTRMGSFPAVALLALGFVARERGLKGLMQLGAAAAPGFLWLALHQRIATGDALRSTQLTYYALSDGPSGCFGWGPGPTRGCLFEHGDYAHQLLPEGLNMQSMLHVGARRVVAHCKDFLAFELLSIAGFAAIARLRGRLGGMALLIPGHIVAYAMFYFDGNFPGGGSRFFAELLPLEFALLALSLVQCARPAFLRWLQYGYLVASVSHGVPGILALRDRFGASPVLAPSPSVIAHNDMQFLVNEHTQHERQGDLRALWHMRREALWSQRSYRFEADDFWPMRLQSEGYAVPRWEANTCASGGRVLALEPEPNAHGRVRFRVPFARGRTAELLISTLGQASHSSAKAVFHNQTYVLPNAHEGCHQVSMGTHQWDQDEDDLELQFDGPAYIDSIVLVDKTP